ncbi:M23 family metallopeptidase [Sedimentibacter sp. MB31-C6]|uniref:M23 family metallopeptidase n=1 Tax=Sedimentibacter sp. MB31-C6 TaxID=3109366 RepID=UPI002DDD1DC9|nr:M23 family metallopeptidase [Sedimentibacter sp. MB36-C1]WSI04380.1 M23 family metallopeptidase [Sedimentibacter sp. MB36-C1]
MNKISKKRISIKRKEQFNKKLALQVVFSIVLVTAVIITKQVNSDTTRQIINTADQKLNETIEPTTVKKNILNFVTDIKQSIPFFSKENSEFVAPVIGTIYQDYGLNKSGDETYYNHGIDILSNTETVKSISFGTVTQVGNNEKLSNYVVIEEGNKTIIYGKLNEAFVKEGDNISKGDIIGALSKESKLLHFEVWEQGESINPVKLFELTH